MRNKVNRNKKLKEEKNINSKNSFKVKKQIPDNIKVLYGKFYVFSFIYIFFFSILYPLWLVKVLNKLSSLILFIFLGSFYIYMIIDVRKNKGRFNSTVFMLLILFVVMAYSFSIVKFTLLP